MQGRGDVLNLLCFFSLTDPHVENGVGKTAISVCSTWLLQYFCLQVSRLCKAKTGLKAKSTQRKQNKSLTDDHTSFQANVVTVTKNQQVIYRSLILLSLYSSYFRNNRLLLLHFHCNKNTQKKYCVLCIFHYYRKVFLH